MRFLLALFACALLVGLSAAQEQTDYERAMYVIRWVQDSHYETLDLSNLGLERIPSEVWQLTWLRVLILGANPAMRDQWSLPANQLSSLPPEISRLSQLEHLDLRGNRLSSLPPEIGQLRHLRILMMGDNQLSSLPHEIAQLDSLCILDLSNNQFRSLPIAIGQLSFLDENIECGDFRSGLLIHGNPLLSPPEDVLAQGTPAILDYLRNEALWHLQKLLAGAASAVGVVTLWLLGCWRWKNRREKPKHKVREAWL